MLCIMGACMMTGLALEARLKRRYCLLREMRESLIFLEKEMAYHRIPLDESLLAVSKRCTTELSALFGTAAAQIRPCAGRSFRELWSEAVSSQLPKDILEEEEVQLFLEAADALCNTDMVLQKTLLQKYAERFERRSTLAWEDCLEKGRLYRRLGGVAGIFLILLLL
jgi:stage III sporulation protein AB